MGKYILALGFAGLVALGAAADDTLATEPNYSVEKLNLPDEVAASTLSTQKVKKISMCIGMMELANKPYREMLAEKQADGEEGGYLVEMVERDGRLQTLWDRALTLNAKADTENAATIWADHADFMSKLYKVDRGFKVAMGISCKVDARKALEAASTDIVVE